MDRSAWHSSNRLTDRRSFWNDPLKWFQEAFFGGGSLYIDPWTIRTFEKQEKHARKEPNAGVFFLCRVLSCLFHFIWRVCLILIVVFLSPSSIHSTIPSSPHPQGSFFQKSTEPKEKSDLGIPCKSTFLCFIIILFSLLSYWSQSFFLWLSVDIWLPLCVLWLRVILSRSMRVSPGVLWSVSLDGAIFFYRADQTAAWVVVKRKFALTQREVMD